MTRGLHTDEISIDAGLVRALVDRAMPEYVDLPALRPALPVGVPEVVAVFARL